MKTTGSRASAVSQTRGFGDLLYDKAGARPSLDLDFAGTGSLRDKITGEYLVEHTRASNGTYIDNEGLIKKSYKNYLQQSENFVQTWLTQELSVSSNVAEAPDGTLTADKAIPSANSNPWHNLYIGTTTVTGAMSLYLKADGMNYCTFGAQVTINSQAQATFNLANGTIHYTHNATAKITDVGNGWYRCVVYPQISGGTLVIHPNTGGALNHNLYGRTGYAGDGTSGVLLWGAMRTDDALNEGDYIKTGSVETAAPRFTHERVETGNLLSKSENFADYTLHNLASIQEYATLSPSGNFDAVKITENTANSTHALQSPYWSFQTGKTYTFSCYLKAGTSTQAGLQIYGGTNLALATFNLTGDGTLGGLSTGVSANISKSDNGWYRCSVTGNPTTTTSDYGAVSVHTGNIGGFTGSNEFIYAWGLQLEEADTVSTYVPSIDTFTSRASNATYVDSAGLIKTAKKNFLTYSEDISQWTEREYGGGQITVTNTTHINPTGEAGSYKCNITGGPTSTSVTGGQVWIQANSTTGGQSNMTASVYIKAETSSDVGKELTYWANDSDGSKNWEKVTLTADWQRVIFDNSTAFQSNVTEPLNLGVNNAGPSTAKTATNTVGFYIWGAQFETGLTATDYVKTTASASGPARYSHDPETLTPTGLYLEPAATNLLTYSNNFSQWTKSSDTTVLTETTSAPDGSSVPWIEVGDYISREVSSPSNGTTYTGSVWLKAETPCTTKLRLMYVEDKVETINLTNEWKRFELTGTYSSNLLRIQVDNRDDLTASTIKIGIWGAQVEEGSHATSYIRTLGSQVTRAADVYTSTANLTETFEPRGLLIEEARTNIVPYSEDFSQSDWHKEYVTATGGYTSPRGDNTAYKVISQTSVSSSSRLRWTFTSSTATSYTCSMFVKPDGIRYLHLRVGAGSGATDNFGHGFDLQEGIAIPGVRDGTFSMSSTANSIEKLPNGWFRVSVTGNAGNGVRHLMPYLSNSATTTTFTGNGTDGLIMWGIQLELNSFPTSYIDNNTGSQKNRSADVASITGDNFGTYRTNYIPNNYGNSAGTENQNISRQYKAALGYDGQKFSATKVIKKSSSIGNGQIRYSPTGHPFTWQTQYLVYTTFVKLGTPELKFFHIRTNAGGAPVGKCVDITTNAITTGYYDGGIAQSAPQSFIVTSLDNGWKKIVIGFENTSNSGNVSIMASRSATSTLTSNIGDFFYVDGEQIEKSDSTYKATNIIENQPTFNSRLGNATYVDSNGLIKTAYRNYAAYSDFVNGWQTAGSLTIANQTTIVNPFNGYDGVAKLHGTSVSTPIAYLDGVNVQGTISVYAKAETSSTFNIISQPVDQSTCSAVTFNLLTETIVDTYGGATGSIENVGNGWYRCIMLPSHVSRFIILNPHNTDSGNVVYSSIGRTTNTGAYGIYFYGVQNVDSITEAGDYHLNTTGTRSGAPRYSHDPETLVPTGLYLEPAATNSWLYSEDLNSWSSVNSTVNSNNAVAPDGTQTADKVTFTDINTTWSIRYQGYFTGTYTWSGWIKTADNTTKDIYLSWGGPDSSQFHTFTATGEWKRFSAVVTPNNQNIHIGNLHNLSPSSWNGGEFYIWGAQLETGRHATSYIPTLGSTVNRPADTYTSTDTTVLDRDGGNKEAFFNQGGDLSYYVEMALPKTNFSRAFDMSSPGECFLHYWRNTETAQPSTYMLYITDAGNQLNNIHHDTNTSVNSHKVALGLSSSSAFGSNGSIQNDNVSVTLPGMLETKAPDSTHIGLGKNNSLQINSTINRMTWWKTRLPNASLTNITQQ